MIAIFEFGTLWFWVFIVAIYFVVIGIQENSKSPGRWSTAWVIATFVALYYLGAGLSLKQLGLHIIHNPLETVAYFLIYTFLGTVWSFYKWKEHVQECTDKFEKFVEKYTEEIKAGYKYATAPKIDGFRPDLVDYRGEIFNWIFYWPFSVTWFVVHEPIERLFRYIMEITKKVYEGITDKAFSKVKALTEVKDDMVH